MISAKQCTITTGVIVLVQLLSFYLQQLHTEVQIIAEEPRGGASAENASEAAFADRTRFTTYEESAARVLQDMKESVYQYDKDRQLPLMRLREAQKDRVYRVAHARRWLKSQRLVIAASVRNAMNGLESSVVAMRHLGDLFLSVTVVFVENDSQDQTRSYLHALTKQSSHNFRVFLLGCGTVNAEAPCHLNISYATSGRKHRSGHMEQAGRTEAEESVDRGLVMAALRNMYLNFIYTNVRADLLLVLEADVQWKPWNMDAVTQGLYYFKAMPRLDSLCAFINYGSAVTVHDPCTLIFYHAKHFFVGAKETSGPFVDRLGNVNDAFRAQFSDGFWGRKVPAEPVKVAACFQGAAFYRLSSLRAASAFYRYSEGEWHCEHSTLSRQLRENYLDTQMTLSVDGHAAG